VQELVKVYAFFSFVHPSIFQLNLNALLGCAIFVFNTIYSELIQRLYNFH